MILMLFIYMLMSQYLKLRETYLSSYDMTLVTSHVIPNVFFGKGSLHKSVNVDLLRIL